MRDEGWRTVGWWGWDFKESEEDGFETDGCNATCQFQNVAECWEIDMCPIVTSQVSTSYVPKLHSLFGTFI